MANLAVTAANVLKGANSKIQQGIAGATITAGMTLYADGTALGVLKPAAAGSTAALGVVAGIALNGAGIGQPVFYTNDDDDFTPGATLVTGTMYVQSATAGLIAPAADLVSTNWADFLFVAKSTTKAKLKIVNSQAQV